MKHHILVVDDDEEFFKLIDHELSRSGHTAVHAKSEKEAKELLEQTPFSCALIDVILGPRETSGAIVRFLGTCKFESPNYEIPVILCSAYMNSAFEQKVKEKGVNIIETLTKPLPQGALSTCLKKLPTRNVLLLDDDREFSILIERELKHEGFIPILAKNVDEAKFVLERNRMLCGIFDVFLGERFTSEAVIQYLKSEENKINSSMPVIVTSALLPPKHIELLKKQSKRVAFVIPKPAAKGVYAMACKSIYSSKNKNLLKVDGFEKLENYYVPSCGNEEEAKVIVSGVSQHLEIEDVIIIKGTHETESEDEVVLIKEGTVSDYLDNETIKVKRLTTEKDLSQEQEDILKVKRLESSAQKKRIIDEGLNKRNDSGDTPLMIAAMVGDFKKVKELVDNGASVLLKSRNGKTALHYAASSGNLDIVILLIDCGSKVTVRDNEDIEPLGEAILAQQVDIVKELIKQGSRLKTRIKTKPYLIVALEYNNIDLFKALIEGGSDIDVKDPESGFFLKELLEKKEKNDWIILIQKEKANLNNLTKSKPRYKKK